DRRAGDPVRLTGETRVVLDDDRRVPVRRVGERAVAGEDALGWSAGHEGREILVVVQPGAGEGAEQNQAGGEAPEECGTKDHRGDRLRKRPPRVNCSYSIFLIAASAAQRIRGCSASFFRIGSAGAAAGLPIAPSADAHARRTGIWSSLTEQA